VNAKDAIDRGYVLARDMPDGSVVAVMAMTFGKGRLCLDLNEFGHEGVYCYETLGEAARAMYEYDGETEPSGWIRHPQSGRRRLDKTPASEVVFH